MPARIPAYRSLPDPWRGRIGLRRTRRYAQAVILQRAHNARQPADAPTLNFYPMLPGPNSSMAHILARLAVRIGSSPRADQATFAWETGTYFPAADARRLPEGAINRRCLDISKGNVDRIWEETAGYSISVDPRITSGPIVVKPELNGKHAGRVIEGPIARPERDMVYQRLVDSRTDDGRILQLRLVIINSRLIFTYAKWRPYPSWFKGTELTLPRQSAEFLDAAEQELLLRFAAAIGIEYGELDVLRDRHSSLLYVVDANRTPVRPKGLAPDMEDEAFGPQAEALEPLIAR
jgi:hypothetical protein